MKDIITKIQEKMIHEGWKLSTAESCTSGRIAAMLTSVSGASNYFQGSMVAYQDWVKEEYLDVDEEDIEKYDVVSQPVVERMVMGACHMFRSQYAVATTGYAGDGMNGIPAGTIWIGWGTWLEQHSLCLHLSGSREENTQQAAEEVLKQLLRYIEEK